jgi:hypothetical protein
VKASKPIVTAISASSDPSSNEEVKIAITTANYMVGNDPEIEHVHFSCLMFRMDADRGSGIAEHELHPVASRGTQVFPLTGWKLEQAMPRQHCFAIEIG